MVLAVILVSSLVQWREARAEGTTIVPCAIAPRVRCVLITSTEGSGSGARERLRAIALWRHDNGCDSCALTDTASRRALLEHDHVVDSVAETFGWRRMRAGACTLCDVWRRSIAGAHGDSIRVDGLTMFVPSISDEATVFLVERDLSPNGGSESATATISSKIDEAFWLRPKGETPNTMLGWSAYQQQRMAILRRALSEEFRVRRFFEHGDSVAAVRR